MDKHSQLSLGKCSPDFLVQIKWNAFVSDKLRLFYVATPKVACTSLKWWFAELTECAAKIRTHSDSLESISELKIHDVFMKVAPEVTGIDFADIQRAKIDANYFSFCVVRNPYCRIFSAWQSKWLLREPLQIGPYVKEDFMHLPVGSIAEISFAFESFLEYIYQFYPDHYLDPHITPQWLLLRPDLINYSSIAKIENTSELCRQLSAHLGSKYINPFDMLKSNESLLQYRRDFLSDRSVYIISRMYTLDFSNFGYSCEPPPNPGVINLKQFESSILGVQMLRGKNDRLSEIRDGFNREVSKLRSDLIECQARADLLVCQEQQRLRSLGDELTRCEAQLSLLKDVLVSDFNSEQL